MDIYDWIQIEDNNKIIKNWFKSKGIVTTNISLSSNDYHNMIFIEFKMVNISYLIIFEKENSIKYVKELEPIIGELKPFILSMIRDEKINNILI